MSAHINESFTFTSSINTHDGAAKICCTFSSFGAKQFRFWGAEQTRKLWRRRCHKRFSIIKIGRRLFTPPILSISRAHWREKVKCSRRAFFLNWRAFSLATVAFLRPRFLHVYNYPFSSYPSSSSRWTFQTRWGNLSTRTTSRSTHDWVGLFDDDLITTHNQSSIRILV